MCNHTTYLVDNTGEKPTVMLYTYFNRHAGAPDKKSKTKPFLVHNKAPYTIRAYSLEHKQCYKIVTGKEGYIYILQQVHRDIL